MNPDFEEMGVRAVVRDAARYESDMRRVQASTDATAGTIKKAAGGLTQLGSSLQSIGWRAANAGRNMSLALTLPIVGVGAAATKLAIDFESQMLKIATLTNTPKEEIEGLRQGILALSHELGVAPVEVAAGAYFALSAGLKDSAEAMEVMRIAGKAAALGLGDQATIVNLVTSVMTAYGKSAKDAGKVTDTLIGIVAAGKGEPAEFASSIGMLLPLAAQMGIQFDEVGAVLATLTNQGLGASEASTYLRGVLTQLISPSDRAKKKFEEMGLPLEKFRAEVRKGFVPAMAALIKATGGSEVALAELFPDVRGLIGVLGAFTGQLGQTENNLVTIKGASGSLDKGWQELSKTQGFQLKQSLTDINIALTELGDSILPILVGALKPAVGTITDLVGAFAKLPEPVQQSIVLMGGLVAAAGPMLFTFGALAKGLGIVFTAAGGLTAAVPALVAALGTMASALGALSVVGLGVAAVLYATDEGARNSINGVLVNIGELEARLLRFALPKSLPFPGIDEILSKMDRLHMGTDELEKMFDGAKKAATSWAEETAAQLTAVSVEARDTGASLDDINAAKIQILAENLKTLLPLMTSTTDAGRVLAPVWTAAFEGMITGAGLTTTQIGALVDRTVELSGTTGLAAAALGEQLTGVLSGMALPAQAAADALGEVGVETKKIPEAVDPAVVALADLRKAAEEGSKGTIDAIKSLLPATNETFAEWSKRLDEMANDYVNFQSNLQSILGQLVQAHIDSPELIIEALEKAGPEVTATMAEQLAAGGVAAVDETLKDLGTVAGTNTAAMADAVLKNTPAVKAAAAEVARQAQAELDKVPGTKTITVQAAVDWHSFTDSAGEIDRILRLMDPMIWPSRFPGASTGPAHQQGVWRVPGPWNVDQFPSRLAGGEMVLPAPFAEEMRRFMSGAHVPVATPAFLSAAGQAGSSSSSSTFTASISVESEGRISAAIRRELRGLMFSSGFVR